MRTLERTPAKLMNEEPHNVLLTKLTHARMHGGKMTQYFFTPAPCCVGQVGKQGKLEILRRKNDDAV